MVGSCKQLSGDFQERLYPLASVKSEYRYFLVGIMIAGNHLSKQLLYEIQLISYRKDLYLILVNNCMGSDRLILSI